MYYILKRNLKEFLLTLNSLYLAFQCSLLVLLSSQAFWMLDYCSFAYFNPWWEHKKNLIFYMSCGIVHVLASILLTSWDLNVCSVKLILGRKGIFRIFRRESINWVWKENSGLDRLFVDGFASESCLARVVDILWIDMLWRNFYFYLRFLFFGKKFEGVIIFYIFLMQSYL